MLKAFSSLGRMLRKPKMSRAIPFTLIKITKAFSLFEITLIIRPNGKRSKNQSAVVSSSVYQTPVIIWIIDPYYLNYWNILGHVINLVALSKDQLASLKNRSTRVLRIGSIYWALQLTCKNRKTIRTSSRSKAIK